MNKPREAVRSRRARLVERAARERDELARQLGEWQQPLRTVERGLAVYRGVRRTLPVIGFGAGVVMEALAFVRPDSISGWVQNALELWRVLTARRRDMAHRAEPPAATAPARAEPAAGNVAAS